MYLELHDNEEGNTLCASIPNIDFDYQAEQYVQETYNDRRAVRVIKWLLKDEQGVRCQWERPIGSSELPEITGRSKRFTGEWQRGSHEVEILETDSSVEEE